MTVVADPPERVLFACTFNAVRSPMAQAIGAHLFAHRISFSSVGVRAGELNPFAVAVMDEIGINIAGYQPRVFKDLGDAMFDLVISLSPEAQHAAVELTRRMDCELEYWPTFDATVGHGSRNTILDGYREVRDSLMKSIKDRFAAGEVPNF